MSALGIDATSEWLSDALHRSAAQGAGAQQPEAFSEPLSEPLSKPLTEPSGPMESVPEKPNFVAGSPPPALRRSQVAVTPSPKRKRPVCETPLPFFLGVGGFCRLKKNHLGNCVELAQS